MLADAAYPLTQRYSAFDPDMKPYQYREFVRVTVQHVIRPLPFCQVEYRPEFCQIRFGVGVAVIWFANYRHADCFGELLLAQIARDPTLVFPFVSAAISPGDTGFEIIVSTWPAHCVSASPFSSR